MRLLKFLSAIPFLLCANIFAASDKADTIESVKRSIECDAMRCQPCQDDPCNPCCRLLPAYNAPASPALECSWDWYVEGSFIYWEAMLENMALGDKAFFPILLFKKSLDLRD